MFVANIADRAGCTTLEPLTTKALVVETFDREKRAEQREAEHQGWIEQLAAQDADEGQEQRG